MGEFEEQRHHVATFETGASVTLPPPPGLASKLQLLLLCSDCTLFIEIFMAGELLPIQKS